MAEADPMIGHNGAPADTPYEAFKGHIDDLLVEAQAHLDGEPILTEPQAESVAKLLDMLRKTRKDADEARAIEKKPFDDAAKEIQARWKPLLDRCDLGATTAKQALAPWLELQEKAKREAAEAARKEAEAKAELARKALEQAQASDLAAREEAERLLKDASKAEKAANRLDKDKAMVAGGSRAVSLRSVRTATVTDYVELLAHYKATRPELLKKFLDGEADADVRAGARSLPGVEITETKVAV